MTDPSGFNGSPFQEAFTGSALPMLARVFLCLPLLLAGVVLLPTNRVFQLPNVLVMAGVAACSLLLLVCSAFSDFASSGFVQGLTWMVYAGALMITVAAIGRKTGPKFLYCSIGLGCGLAAIRGVMEYMAVSNHDPGFRIFAGWIDPNAIATIYVLAAPILAGLAAKGPRWLSAVAVVLGAINLAALWHTGSKGGMLALAVALASFLIFAFMRKAWKPALLALLSTVVLGAVVVKVIQPPVVAHAQVKTAAPAGAAASAPRQFDMSANSAQSMTFRVLLWKSTLKLMGSHPMGIGAGNFRYYSSQPGLVDQTIYSHQSWLQIALEGSVLALAAIGAALYGWYKCMLKSDGDLPVGNALLRAGVIGAVTGIIAHGFIESNLYNLGTGIIFFMLLGLGLQLTATGSSPEMTSSSYRMSAVVLCLAVLFGLVSTGASELSRSSFINSITTTDQGEFQAAVEQFKLTAGNDPESLYLLGLHGARSNAERVDYLKRATAASPRTKWIRLYAGALATAGDIAGAREQYKKALTYDPVNLRTLAALYKLEDQAGQKDDAITYAKQLVALETQPVFTIRAIPEVIPTETYDARLYLAQHTTDPKDAIANLVAAVHGYVMFADTTYPRVKKFAAIQGAGDFAGMSMKDADAVLDQANTAATLLNQLATQAGDTEAVKRATEALADFKAAPTR